MPFCEVASAPPCPHFCHSLLVTPENCDIRRKGGLYKDTHANRQGSLGATWSLAVPESSSHSVMKQGRNFTQGTHSSYGAWAEAWGDVQIG